MAGLQATLCEPTKAHVGAHYPAQLPNLLFNLRTETQRGKGGPGQTSPEEEEVEGPSLALHLPPNTFPTDSRSRGRICLPCQR